MSTYPFPTKAEFAEAWTSTMEILDKGINEDVKGIAESMRAMYGRGLTAEEAQLAQLILVTVCKSTSRLTLAVINTYLCTDRARSEAVERMRARMAKPATPESEAE
jgi:hypothetical protein